MMTHYEKETLMRHEKVLFGTEPDSSDGIVAIVTTHDAALHGTDRNPGGLISSVDRLTKALYVGSGMVLAAQIGWAVFVYVTSKH